MQALVELGCGLDVHQVTVVACLLMVSRNGKVRKQMRTYGTTTRETAELAAMVTGGRLHPCGHGKTTCLPSKFPTMISEICT